MLFKTSWHQEHIDRWTREFGQGAEILCRVVLLNIESRSAVSRKREDANLIGRCLVDTKCKKSQEIWVFVKVSGGILLVNEGTGAHIVAQGECGTIVLAKVNILTRVGHGGPVACTHDEIDTQALWELDYDAGHMM